jgi:hypothetical protein
MAPIDMPALAPTERTAPVIEVGVVYVLLPVAESVVDVTLAIVVNEVVMLLVRAKLKEDHVGELSNVNEVDGVERTGGVAVTQRRIWLYKVPLEVIVSVMKLIVPKLSVGSPLAPVSW